jgi:hypothetical protein
LHTSDLARLPAFAGDEISRDYTAMSPTELVAAFFARFNPQSQKHMFNRVGMIGALVMDNLAGVNVDKVNGIPVKRRYVGLDERAKRDMEQATAQAEFDDELELLQVPRF